MSIIKSAGSPEIDGTFRPQLTSLIDVMTILLVFLIKSFSVDGNIVTQSDDLVLPVSTSDVRPKQQCAIEITNKAIISDGEIVATLDDIARSDSLLIEPLYKWMKMKGTHCGDTTKGKELMIQCDRELPYSNVKRVMYSCSKAGFSRFSVLVIQEE